MAFQSKFRGQYFLKNLNLRSFLVMFVSSLFKHDFKIVHIPVLTHIHFEKVIYDDKMCIAVI